MLPIRLYTDPSLSKVCKPITDFDDPSLEILVQEMIQTMQGNNGVGLAAPQVGEDKQLAILHVENRTKILVLINPKIVAYSKKKVRFAEGCLSCPGLTVQMKRPVTVIVDANTLTGEQVRYEFTDFDSKIAMHEIDHLHGKHLGQTVKNYVPVL
jgi:peptide deformylase